MFAWIVDFVIAMKSRTWSQTFQKFLYKIQPPQWIIIWHAQTMVFMRKPSWFAFSNAMAKQLTNFPTEWIDGQRTDVHEKQKLW